jgi:hypothetical protein
MKPEITVSGGGHAYGVDPGDVWFAGQVTGGPAGILGRRVAVHLTEEAAVQLATELLVIVSSRRSRPVQCGDGPEVEP